MPAAAAISDIGRPPAREDLVQLMGPGDQLQQAGLDCGYGSRTAFFTWTGFDQMDESAATARPNMRTTEASYQRSLVSASKSAFVTTMKPNSKPHRW